MAEKHEGFDAGGDISMLGHNFFLGSKEAKLRETGRTEVTTSAVTILSLSNLYDAVHVDGVLILVTGQSTADSGKVFTEFILLNQVNTAAAAFSVVGSVTSGAVAGRTYTFSSGNFRLAMASGTYGVRVSALQVKCGQYP